MWDMISPDMSEVLNYLRVDCPFEFYWYDKTSATRSSYSKGFGISSEDGGQSWIFNTEGIEVTYSFPVAEEYRGETVYTIRTSLLQSVQTAADNAKQSWINTRATAIMINWSITEKKSVIL